MSPNDVNSTEALSFNKNGEDLFAKGCVSEAVQQFELAVSTDSQCAVALNNLAVCLWELGESKRSLEILEQAIYANPQDRSAMLNYASIVNAATNINVTKEIFESYVKQHPDDTEIKTALATVTAQILRLTLSHPSNSSVK